MPGDGSLLQRKANCACGGGCPRCESNLPIQTKLAVSEPGDAYELEADEISEQVMRMPAAALEPNATSRSISNSESSASEKRISRVDQSDTVSHSPLKDLGPGQPLDESARAFFEPRFNTDFSAVRVYTGAQASESAMAFGARAYTLGNHIVFGAHQYAPDTAYGRSLIAHELVHIGQQRSQPTVQRDLLPSWQEIRDTAYRGMIDGLRSLQRSGIARLRAMAVGLPETQRTIVNGIITAVDAVAEILIRLIFAVVGVVVGFGAGIVQAIVGLIRLLAGIIQGILLFLYGFIDGGDRFNAWAEEVLSAIRRIPEGLRLLVTTWLAEFERASEDRQTVMVGELVGQIIAIIATFEFVAARAGAVPRLAAQLGTTGTGSFAAIGGGGRAVAGLAISIDVASPAAAAVYTGAYAMSATAAIGSLYGEGPETRAIQETSRYRAGAASRPRHHIFPQEHRNFFRDRGFADIDDFCVELEEAHHQALHGGGDWRLGRSWPGEWNRRIMAELRRTEGFLHRPLTRSEIITIGRELMVEYGIEEAFVPFQ
jgi:uncharacterized protein DUF4157/predicted lipoprotein DUF2380